MQLVDIANLHLPDWGWHLDDPEETAKLTGSLFRHGQIQSLLTRHLGDGHFEIVDGRRRLNIMRQMPDQFKMIWICDLGSVSKEEALQHALSLELVSGVDYAKMAVLVKSLQETDSFLSLPMFTPFSGERIGYFVKLTEFDWSQYVTLTEQAMLFDEEGAPERPAPAAPTPVAKVVAAPRTPSHPPADTANGAALRAAARAAVSGAVNEDQGLQGFNEGPILDIPNSPKVSQEVSIVMGDDFALPQDSNWRPEAPPSLDGIDQIELDCETNGLKWWAGHRPVGMSLRIPDGRKWYLPWAHKGGGNLDEAVVKRWAERELRGKIITNANVKFDNHMLWHWGIDLEAQGNVLADVQHYAALLDEYRKEFGLGFLAKDFLGQDKVGQELDKTKMAEYHAGQVAPYAMHDVHLVGELKKVLLPLMDVQDLGRVRDLECAVIYPNCEMERNAANVDRARLREWVTDSARMLQGLLFDVAREVGFQMNPDKNADWVKLFKALNIPITNFTAPSQTYPQGQASFGDDYLEKVPHPLVQLARKTGKLASVRSKFLVPYAEVVGEDNKLRFALHQLRGDEYGTIRGRFSMAGASKGIGQFGANLQQVMRVNSQREAFGFNPSDSSHDEEIFLVRSLFTAERGDYLSADAQSIEYRIAVHFAEAKKLIDAYQADFKQLAEGRLTDKWVDFHGVVGEFINPVKKVTRNIVKNLNFCLVYGGGEDTAARTLGMTRAESDPIVGIWRRTFPEFKALHRKASALAEGRGFVRTIMGRRARFPDKTWCHAAINYVIQGSAADIMKKKLVELHAERKYTGLVLRQTVHDEADGDSTQPETAARVREVLNRQSFPQLKVPIVWEVATGKNWAEAH